MFETDHAKYRCLACKKEIKNLVIQCKTCVRFYFHPRCVAKHKSYREKEFVKCDGSFEKIAGESKKPRIERMNTEKKGTELMGSEGKTTSTAGKNYKQPIDLKTEWLIKTVKEMKDEMASKNEIKEMIRQIIREELIIFKQEIEKITGRKQEQNNKV